MQEWDIWCRFLQDFCEWPIRLHPIRIPNFLEKVDLKGIADLGVVIRWWGGRKFGEWPWSKECKNKDIFLARPFYLQKKFKRKITRYNEALDKDWEFLTLFFQKNNRNTTVKATTTYIFIYCSKGCLRPLGEAERTLMEKIWKSRYISCCLSPISYLQLS